MITQESLDLLTQNLPNQLGGAFVINCVIALEYAALACHFDHLVYKLGLGLLNFNTSIHQWKFPYNIVDHLTQGGVSIWLTG